MMDSAVKPPHSQEETPTLNSTPTREVSLQLSPQVKKTNGLACRQISNRQNTTLTRKCAISVLQPTTTARHQSPRILQNRNGRSAPTTGPPKTPEIHSSNSNKKAGQILPIPIATMTRRNTQPLPSPNAFHALSNSSLRSVSIWKTSTRKPLNCLFLILQQQPLPSLWTISTQWNQESRSSSGARSPKSRIN
jgi:hypothetical protein